MVKLITRPTDNYSSDWIEYWKQNPSMRRGVGADAADPPADPPADTPAPDPRFESMAASIAALEGKNRELLKEKADNKKLADQKSLDNAKTSGDMEALEQSWKDKYTSRESELTHQLDGYQKMISDSTSGQQAVMLAAEMSIPGSADVLLPHIKNRLTTEIQDGKPVLRVLDQQGKLSAMSVDDLRKEIESNPAFAPLLIGSLASGGGSITQGGKPTGKTMLRSQFNALSHRDQDAFVVEGGIPVDS
jgi:hypothetical protein